MVDIAHITFLFLLHNNHKNNNSFILFHSNDIVHCFDNIHENIQLSDNTNYNHNNNNFFDHNRNNIPFNNNGNNYRNTIDDKDKHKHRDSYLEIYKNIPEIYLKYVKKYTNI